jgi:hypothetical protein
VALVKQLKPGVRVRALPGHLRAHETGRIVGPATGGALAAGCEWEVKSEQAYAPGWFASADQLQVIDE